MSKWGDVLELSTSLASIPPVMKFLDKDGKLLLAQNMPSQYDGFPNLITHRGATQRIMYDEAVRLGVKFNFGCRVTGYFEDEECAGIIVNGIDRYCASGGVIAADGIHSRARAFISAKEEKAPPSGFAVYRSWFPLELLKDNPLTHNIATAETDQWIVWVGADIHAILTTNVAMKKCCCFCTHKVS